MMRSLAVTVGLLLCSTTVVADQSAKAKKHRDTKHAVVHQDDGGAPDMTVHVSWTTRDVEVIRRHYGPKSLPRRPKSKPCRGR